MPERLDDADDKKWLYQEHTRTKHKILARYLNGFIPILARSALKRQRLARIMLIDGFAGRGRYVGGEQGSPLVIADVADQVMQHLNTLAAYVQIACAFVEADDENHQTLVREIERARLTAHAAVDLRDPMREPFEVAIKPLLSEARQYDGLFVFADPFGFGDIPLHVMKAILSAPQGEVFITFMVRYVNRFLEETDRDRAYASLFGVHATQLAAVRQAVVRSSDRERALRDYYMERLRLGAGARYICAFRMFPEGGDQALYYLIQPRPTHYAVSRR